MNHSYMFFALLTFAFGTLFATGQDEGPILDPECKNLYSNINLFN